jgi:hypothetical protein
VKADGRGVLDEFLDEKADYFWNEFLDEKVDYFFMTFSR